MPSRPIYPTLSPQQNFQQPQIINAQTNGCQKYKSKAAAVVGILQIVLGSSILAASIAIYVTIIKLVVEYSLSLDAGGWGYSQFWAPGLVISAGVFGVISARAKAYGRIVGTMIFSILSSLAILPIIAQGALFFAYLDILIESHDALYIFTSNDYIFMICFGVFLAFGCVEFIAAIVAAALCCHGCCGQNRPGVAQPGMILSPYAPPKYEAFNGKEFPQGENNF